MNLQWHGFSFCNWARIITSGGPVKQERRYVLIWEDVDGELAGKIVNIFVNSAYKARWDEVRYGKTRLHKWAMFLLSWFRLLEDSLELFDRIICGNSFSRNDKQETGKLCPYFEVTVLQARKDTSLWWSTFVAPKLCEKQSEIVIFSVETNK